MMLEWGIPKGFRMAATGKAAAAGRGPMKTSALSASSNFLALSAATVGLLAESSLTSLISLPATFPPNSLTASSAAFNIQGFGVALVPVKQPRFPMTTGLRVAGWEGALVAMTNKANANTKVMPSAENMLFFFIVFNLLFDHSFSNCLDHTNSLSR
jgi:hypothetical protein